MKYQIKIFLTITILFFIGNSIYAQGNFEADGAAVGAGPTLFGNNASALYWDSDHITHSQLVMRNRGKTQLGRLYGVDHSTGVYFGILDGDANWSIRSKKDSFTEFRINNKIISSVDAYGLNIQARDNTNIGGRLTLLGAGTHKEWRVDNFVGNYRLYTGGSVKFRINSNGNVGIGNNINAQNKLDVDGTIRAKEVKVEAVWADYVFDEAYELPSLDAEKENIENNGHLLGFDSEEDMAGEVHLGDVAVKQQVKIEEMMLHLIEMKQEIKELQEDKASLSTELELLKQ